MLLVFILFFFRYFHFIQRKLEVIYLIASLIIYLKPQRRFQIRILLNQSDKVITFGQLINFCYQLILSIPVRKSDFDLKFYTMSYLFCVLNFTF